MPISFQYKSPRRRSNPGERRDPIRVQLAEVHRWGSKGAVIPQAAGLRVLDWLVVGVGGGHREGHRKRKMERMPTSSNVC